SETTPITTANTTAAPQTTRMLVQRSDGVRFSDSLTVLFCPGLRASAPRIPDCSAVHRREAGECISARIAAQHVQEVWVAQLLILTSAPDAEVLPSLALLSHRTRQIP